MTHANGKRFLWSLALFVSTSLLAATAYGVRAAFQWGTTMTRVHAMLAVDVALATKEIGENADTLRIVRQRQDSVLRILGALAAERCLRMSMSEKVLTKLPCK